MSGIGNFGILNSGSGNFGILNSGSGNFGILNSGSGNFGILNSGGGSLSGLGDLMGAPKSTPVSSAPALPPSCAPVEPPVCPKPPVCAKPQPKPGCLPPPSKEMCKVAKNPCGCKNPQQLGQGLNKQLGQSPDIGKLVAMLQQLMQCLNMQGQAGQSQSPVKYLA
jgi:PPE-repeat protein